MLASNAFRVYRTPAGAAGPQQVSLTNPPSISGAEATLRLAQPVVCTDDAVTVGYTKPTGTGAKLADTDGNETDSFSGQAVANAAQPGVLSGTLALCPIDNITVSPGATLRVPLLAIAADAQSAAGLVIAHSTAGETLPSGLGLASPTSGFTRSGDGLTVSYSGSGRSGNWSAVITWTNAAAGSYPITVTASGTATGGTALAGATEEFTVTVRSRPSPTSPSTPSSGGGPSGGGPSVGGPSVGGPSVGGGAGAGGDGAGGGVTQPVSASELFADVAAGVRYEAAVSWMIAHDITHGCAPAMFCPDQELTRQQFVTFLWRAAGQPTPEHVGSAAFSDVSEGAYSDQAIGWAVSRGVTAGCTPGQPGDPDWRFCPTQPVTRGQMGTFLYRHVEAVHKGRHDRYTDVNPDSAHATGVAWLADYQVIGGCETDKFCPDRPATRAEAAAIIHGVATRPAMWGPGNNSFTPQPAEPQPTEPSEASARFDDVATGVWYEQAVSWMIAHEVTAGCGPRMFCPDRVLTRQQFVTFLWRAAGQPTPEFSGSSAFSDVAEGAYSDQAISWAVSRGVTAGCTEGEPGDPDWRFCPTEPVTRGQMGTFMYRHVQAVHQGRQDRYSDVKPTSTHATGVAWLADFEVIGGCDTAMFCPDRPATRAEAAAIIHGVATRPAMWGPGTNPFTPQPTEPQPTEPSEAPSGSTVQRIGLVSRE